MSSLPAIALALLGLLAAGGMEEGRGSPLLVVIDPGHGGDKEGAVGPEGRKEKDIALAIGKKLGAELEARGYEVLLTREDDVSLGLAPRIDLANERGADLFVSVHANSIASSRNLVQGVETFFLSEEASDAHSASLALLENADDGEAAKRERSTLDAILADLARSEAHAGSSRLAVEIHGKLVRGTDAKDRGVRQAPFFVLSGARMPAVLVEVGYISHPEESRRLADEEAQGRIARSIADGIDAFGEQTLATASPKR